MRSQSKIQCAVEETLATLYQVWGIQRANYHGDFQSLRITQSTWKYHISAASLMGETVLGSYFQGWAA